MTSIHCIRRSLSWITIKSNQIVININIELLKDLFLLFISDLGVYSFIRKAPYKRLQVK